jgi:hypothetical protein
MLRGDSNHKEFGSRQRSPGEERRRCFGQNLAKWRCTNDLGQTIGKKRIEGDGLEISWVIGHAKWRRQHGVC